MTTQASCVVEEVTGLSVCTIDPPSLVAQLHALLQKASVYLEEHHRAVSDRWDAPYHYRNTYLPEYVSGNDVAALSRLLAEAKVRDIVPQVALLPLVTQEVRAPVTSADVEYLAGNADIIVPALEDVYSAILLHDARYRVRIPWMLLAGIGIGIAAATIAKHATRKGG